MKVTIFDNEYCQYCDLDETKIKRVPDEEHYDNRNKVVLVLYS